MAPTFRAQPYPSAKTFSRLHNHLLSYINQHVLITNKKPDDSRLACTCSFDLYFFILGQGHYHIFYIKIKDSKRKFYFIKN
ncbi:hypothetical protein BpHYR1_009660 [Brachionus plicatilis]|uniref:Uncharacterized protein n=1 Tax=Brachionus plicatilis TaxID=10195 RepID=A0A3M7QVP4_BRAPC|nr:hypothetical protein BpHYR1_009660 [Brachionus plicatilis]